MLHSMQKTARRSWHGKPSRGASACGPAPCVALIERAIHSEVAGSHSRKYALHRCVEHAVSGALAPLNGCAVELVGSTSWWGEAPHSDLDLVLVPGKNPENQDDQKDMDETRTANNRNNSSKERDIAILRALYQALQDNLAAPDGEKPWDRLELIEDARVPILQLINADGLHCDVAVDNGRSRPLATFMRGRVEGNPQALRLIRLVKLWLQRRGLPNATEGGVPSISWAMLALHIAEALRGAPIETLLFDFFTRLSQLRVASLVMRRAASGFELEWRKRQCTSWAEEWLPLIWVDDPTQPGSGRGSNVGLTPPSIPTALAALYVTEIQLALKVIRHPDGNWDALWQPASCGASAETQLNVEPASEQNRPENVLHLVLVGGAMRLGRLDKIRRCPNLRRPGLHRWDQSSELVLAPSCLEKVGSRLEARAVQSVDGTGTETICKPCQWICALPDCNGLIIQGDGFSRLLELAGFLSPSAFLCCDKPQVHHTPQHGVMHRWEAPSSKDLHVSHPSQSPAEGKPSGRVLLLAPAIAAMSKHADDHDVDVHLETKPSEPSEDTTREPSEGSTRMPDSDDESAVKGGEDEPCPSESSMPANASLPKRSAGRQSCHLRNSGSKKGAQQHWREVPRNSRRRWVPTLRSNAGESQLQSSCSDAAAAPQSRTPMPRSQWVPSLRKEESKQLQEDSSGEVALTERPHVPMQNQTAIETEKGQEKECSCRCSWADIVRQGRSTP